MTFQQIPCPLCGQIDLFLDVRVPARDPEIRKYGSMYAGRRGSIWKICGGCGFVHQNPRPSVEVLNEIYLQSQYHAPVVMSTESEHMRFARWYYTEKIDYAISASKLTSGCVFDIGCGRGGVLKLFEERGWETFGVEPDPNLAGYANNTLGLSCVQQGIVDRNFKMTKKMDLVFSNHAFEHFANLDDVMKGLQNIIKPGGYLFIAIPTYFGNKSSLSKRWMNSSHYSLFTHRSLSNLLVRYGFEEVGHTYSGWKKEVDDLWYVARFTKAIEDPTVYFEDPWAVWRYLHVVNPLRSLLFYPVYSHWAVRVRMYRGAKLLVLSPITFFQKVTQYFQRRTRAN